MDIFLERYRGELVTYIIASCNQPIKNGIRKAVISTWLKYYKILNTQGEAEQTSQSVMPIFLSKHMLFYVSNELVNFY